MFAGCASEADGKHDGQRLKPRAALTFAFVQREGLSQEGEFSL